MSIVYNTSIVKSGLQLHLDAGNVKSYSGSGNNWVDLISNSNFNTSAYTYPSFASSGAQKYFTFVNNGTTVNNIYSNSIQFSTYTQPNYTRIAWFYLTSYSSSWSPIIQNQIGNNSDMGLTVVSSGQLMFRQYTNTQSSGTASGDYGVNSVGVINTGQWYMAAIAVNRIANTVSFYINGVFDSTVSINVIGNSSSDNIIIGGAITDGLSGGRMFKGYIGSVSHYNRMLSSAEILQNFSAFRGRYGI